MNKLIKKADFFTGEERKHLEVVEERRMMSKLLDNIMDSTLHLLHDMPVGMNSMFRSRLIQLCNRKHYRKPIIDIIHQPCAEAPLTFRELGPCSHLFLGTT